MWTQAGACPHCGAPIYALYAWYGITSRHACEIVTQDTTVYEPQATTAPMWWQPSVGSGNFIGFPADATITITY